MREEDSNWLPKWEDELPPPHELISLSQSLITPHLASAFDIHTPPSHNHHNNHHSSSPQLLAHYHHHQQQQSSSVPPAPNNLQPNSSEFDSSSAELGGGAGGGGGGASSGGGGSEEPARTLKRPRLVWTPQLHKRFVDAVGHLGIKNAVPKTIMQLMSVDGLTRENVASHLQKYRLYLKRMQGGLSNGNGAGPGGGPGGPGGGLVGSGDPATDHLFASSPVPPHFLHQSGGGGGPTGRPNSEHFMPYMPVTALNHHQMAAAAVAGHQQIQSQYQHHHHRQMGHFGPGQGGGQFEHPLLSRQAQFSPNRNGLMQNNNNSGYMDDVEHATTANNGRKVLTLFPTGDD